MPIVCQVQQQTSWRLLFLCLDDGVPDTALSVTTILKYYGYRWQLGIEGTSRFTFDF